MCDGGRGIRARRLLAAHPAPAPARGSGHCCCGLVSGKRGPSARRGACLAGGAQWRKQDRRRLGKKWSRNGKIQTHPLQMVSRCKLRCFRAFPRARPLPPARAPRAHTHSRTHARTHALPGEGRAAASTACNRHTINNNRFLRSGLASRSPASAGGGGGRGAGSSGPEAPPGPILGLPQGSRLRLTQPAGHPSCPPSASASLFAVVRGAGTQPPPPRHPGTNK